MIDTRLGGLYRGLRKIIGKSIELQITDELKVEISDLIGKNLAMPMHTTIGATGYNCEPMNGFPSNNHRPSSETSNLDVKEEKKISIIHSETDWKRS